MQAKFAQMCEGRLFRVALGGGEVWNLYLNSFPKEHNPIFRDPNSTDKNCNLCNNFIRRYGNVVSLSGDNEIITMFDVEADDEYKTTCEILSKAIRSSAIQDVFFETFAELNSLPYESCNKTSEKFQLGTAKNVKRYTHDEAAKFGVVKANETRTFHHLHLFLDKKFVDMSGSSVEAIMGTYRDAKNVFKRAMDGISLDTLQLVKDLIVQGSLLDGATHLYKVEQMIVLKQEYDTLPAIQRDGWCWSHSYGFGLAKFKNELIGVLCSELSEGEELNKACQSWNKRVDPANYMKAIAPITKKQIEEAKEFVEENGYVESFDRRMATIDDIKVSEILHSNVGKGDVKKVSIFDGVKSTSTRHKRNEFEGVEEVQIEKFMKDILPSCSSLEVFFAGGHQGNLVSLTTASDENSKPIFKWNNNYSWTFNGDLAGKSQIKEAVKGQGGKVDGVLRFSIMWAEDSVDDSDLDAHCQEPNGNTIYFMYSISPFSNGHLDIDIRTPQDHKRLTKKDVVENITFPSIKKMTDGVYRFLVHGYSTRQSKGFKAEIEFDGETYSYEYNTGVGIKASVRVADVTLKNGVFTINHLLPECATSSKEIYGMETNQFHKVNLMCLSPNHWGENNVGNKHYFFMLDGCQSPTSIRGFHNENLLPELAQHRKVLEVLGATNTIPSSKKQLSGLGFNATVRDEVLVKLQGTHKRIIKLKF